MRVCVSVRVHSMIGQINTIFRVIMCEYDYTHVGGSGGSSRNMHSLRSCGKCDARMRVCVCECIYIYIYIHTYMYMRMCAFMWKIRYVAFLC
jgi:hypothetical protein